MIEADFVQAAKKGMGRALIALRTGDFTPTDSQLRRLALRWHGYDSQVEDARGWYSVEMLTQSRSSDELRALLFRLAGRIKSRHSHRRHRDAMIEELARRGDDQARKLMYSMFDAEADRFGDEIVHVDGIAGLEWLLDQIGPTVTDEKAWQVHGWVGEAEEVCTKEALADWVAQGPARPFIEFTERARAPRTDRTPPTAKSFEEYRKEWEQHRVRYSAPQWVRHAAEEEVAKAWDALRRAVDEDWIRTLAHGLWRRPDPRQVPWLIDRARSWPEARNPFVTAMTRQVSGPLRDFGLELLGSGRVEEGLALLESNAIREDEHVIMNRAQVEEGADDLHGTGMSLLSIGERLDLARPLLWVYENSPCSFCRYSAVQKLSASHLAPRKILEECLSDCVDDTRDVAAKELESREHLCP